jgi:UDP-N-acetylglucosamine 1-carboxyvinyltransferase
VVKLKLVEQKNSAVALIPATILADTEVTIDGVPNISDVYALAEMLKDLNAGVKIEGEKVVVDPSTLENRDLLEGAVQKLRASYYFMGALLGKFKELRMGIPGGCNLGPRPMDYHIKGFEALGAKVTIENGVYHLKADELKGAKIYLDFASVGATINIMLAAVKAKGRTIIENAAREPEIIDVATLLNNMGARIRGAGTDVIRIDGVDELHGCYHKVIPDRIEAGTYIVAAALAGDRVEVKNVIPTHIEALLSKMEEAGVKLDVKDDSVVVYGATDLKSVDIKTQVYPGFVTDMQQYFNVLLTQAKGTGIVEETIYSARYKHIEHLNNMGANIRVVDGTWIIMGPTPLYGAKVEATDLRAGATMLLAGLIAEGVTEISNIHHVDRGYENVEEKLLGLGAKIWREEK